ncbi:MAG: 50S ribosomal protein L35 [Patescibacteria group bacterium]
MKSNKSFSKRIKVTKTGKLLRRPGGQNHFNSKDASEKTMQKRGLKKISFNSRIKRRFLPGTSNKS